MMIIFITMTIDHDDDEKKRATEKEQRVEVSLRRNLPSIIITNLVTILFINVISIIIKIIIILDHGHHDNNRYLDHHHDRHHRHRCRNHFRRCGKIPELI